MPSLLWDCVDVCRVESPVMVPFFCVYSICLFLVYGVY